MPEEVPLNLNLGGVLENRAYRRMRRFYHKRLWRMPIFASFSSSRESIVRLLILTSRACNQTLFRLFYIVVFVARMLNAF